MDLIWVQVLVIYIIAVKIILPDSLQIKPGEYVLRHFWLKLKYIFCIRELWS